MGFPDILVDALEIMETIDKYNSTIYVGYMSTHGLQRMPTPDFGYNKYKLVEATFKSKKIVAITNVEPFLFLLGFFCV